MANKRVYMVVSYLVDDNYDAVTPPRPIASTFSTKVMRSMMEAFFSLYRENGTISKYWPDDLEHALPGVLPKGDDISPNLAKFLDDKQKSVQASTGEGEGESALGNLVDF